MITCGSGARDLGPTLRLFITTMPPFSYTGAATVSLAKQLPGRSKAAEESVSDKGYRLLQLAAGSYDLELDGRLIGGIVRTEHRTRDTWVAELLQPVPARLRPGAVHRSRARVPELRRGAGLAWAPRGQAAGVRTADIFNRSVLLRAPLRSEHRDFRCCPRVTVLSAVGMIRRSHVVQKQALQCP